MKGKTTQVICNSKNKISGTNNDAYYNIDWSSILKNNMPYYVSFTYSAGLNVYDGSKPAAIRVNFNLLSYRIIASLFNFQQVNILGLLEPFVIRPNANNVQLNATTDTNLPAYMETRPINNLFNIKIVRTELSLWLDNDTTPKQPADYIIILHFTEAITPLYKSNAAFGKVPKATLQRQEPLGPSAKKIHKLYISSDFGGSGSYRFYSLNGLFDKSKEYKVSFSFVGAKPNTGNNGQPILLFINFNNEAYIPNAIPFSCTSKSGYVGYIARTRFDISIDSSYLSASITTNEPVNTIVDYQGWLYVTFTNLDLTRTTYLPTNWILHLNFEEI